MLNKSRMGWGRGAMYVEEEVLILNRVVWVGVIEKLRLKQRLEWNERVRSDLWLKGSLWLLEIDGGEERTR